jgi:hypothetical protein
VCGGITDRCARITERIIEGWNSEESSAALSQQKYISKGGGKQVEFAKGLHW